MNKKIFFTSMIFITVIFCLSFSACAGSPSTTDSSADNSADASGKSGNSGTSLAEAQAMAQAAFDRMDGAWQPSSGQQGASAQQPQTPSSSQSGQSPAPSSVSASTGARPSWVDSAESVYSRSQYVSAVGTAASQEMAERNALANLVAYFGQSIQADQTITNTYQEAVRNGITSDWSDNTAINNTIRTSASMDTLVGAEIRSVWYDSRGTYYAAAVLEKTRAAQVYSDMIIANQNMIKNLLAMDQTEKNSIGGISRYQFAAAVADINTSYGNLLRLIEAPLPEGMISGSQYRLEAQNITRAIPIGIRVSNDKAGRIQSAFAKAVTDLGFRSGGTNSRYVLQVELTVSPVDLPNNPNKFARMELNAVFSDTLEGTNLLTYSFNLREGHLTLSEAENRTFLAAERKINEEYKNLLSDYLAALMPVR